MLEALFGTKNLQRILLFLFVNGKCYGTQLHKTLSVSLTPLQQALARLEKGGVIVSYYEGKTRVYQFNPAFPLLGELEALLKKSYTLLSPQEKKQYCSVKDSSLHHLTPQQQLQTLLSFWKRLEEIKNLMVHAETKSKEGGWKGQGKGEVVMTKEGDNILLFQEKGIWKTEQGEIDFSNLFRWTLDRLSGMISLEHLRRGANHPVFLFHLAPSGAHSLASVDSHLCAEDSYFGQLFADRHGLRLHWRVIGPKKNEELDYFYS